MKKIVSIILAALATIGFTVGATGCSSKAQAALEKVGAMITDVVEENGISLKTVAVSADEVSAQAESAYTLTATITPSAIASISKIDWSVSFVNASSTWASGKTVTDYVTVTPSSDGAKTATVKCLKEFGEQITVKAAVRGRATTYATCVCNYIARPTTINATFGEGSGSVLLSFDFKKGSIGQITLTSAQAFGSTVTLTNASGGVGTNIVSIYKLKLDYSKVFTDKIEAAGYDIATTTIEYSEMFSSEMMGSIQWRPRIYLPLNEPDVLGEYGEMLCDAYLYAFDGEGTITEAGISLYNAWRTALFETQNSGNNPVKLTLQQATSSGDILQEFVVNVTYDESIFPEISANNISLNSGALTF